LRRFDYKESSVIVSRDLPVSCLEGEYSIKEFKVASYLVWF